MSDKKTKVFAAIIISVSVVLAITSVWNDSLIVDEIPHIGAGYSYLVKHDLRLNPEHPPLAKDLAAIPLLFLKLKQDAFETKPWLSDINGQWEFGRKLIFNSGNNADLITHLAKLPMLLFFILAAVLVFKWGKKLYGHSGGLIALTLFSFSPTVLAHARFVTTDLAALFGILIATYFFINYLESRSPKNFWLAAITFGLALLTKFSTFLLVPYFIVLALIHSGFRDGRSTRLGSISALGRTILLFIVGVLVVVWPVYFFNTYHYPPAHQKADTTYLLRSYGRRSLADTVIWASDKPGIRALSSYGLGLLMVNQRAIGGNTTYFLGEVTTSSWKKYFPIVYFIKEPLAWWGLVIVALLALLKVIHLQGPTLQGSYPQHKQQWFKNHFSELAMLLWLLIYWAVSIKSNLNIGIRHLLPTYPFAILLVSGQISKMLDSSRKRTAVFVSSFLVFFLMTWYVMETAKAYPYYLPYFNQTVGGSSGGYKYVVDSNLDWGQDLKRFSQWVKENKIPKIELDYFGWADPVYYLGNSYERLSSQKYKSAEDFRAHNHTNGWLAVSATFLEGSEGGPPERPSPINYLWLQQIQPVTTIGHSIFVYQIK